MSHEFAEAVREVVEQAHHRINTAVGRGESYSELEEAVTLMDVVVSELRSALEDVEDLRGEVHERAESMRERLDPDSEEQVVAEPDAAGSERTPGGFGGSLVAREGFDDPLPEDVVSGFKGQDAADAREGSP